MTVEKLNSAHSCNRLKASHMKPSEQERLRNACRDFEAIFMNQMLDSMRDTLTGTPVFGNSLGKDIYESMYYRQLTSDIAHGGRSLGISELLYDKLESQVTAHHTASDIRQPADVNSIGKIKE